MLDFYKIHFLVLILINVLADNIFPTAGQHLSISDSAITLEERSKFGDVFFEIIDPAELEYTYRLRPAKDFGKNFNAQFKLTGMPLVPTNPPDACTKFKNARELRGNVALIARGDCSFLTKTINAERAGAAAVIIYDNDVNSPEFDFFIEMVHDNTPRDTLIPAGYMMGKNGLIITSTLKKLKRSYALVNLPVNLTFTPLHRINHPPWLPV